MDNQIKIDKKEVDQEIKFIGNDLTLQVHLLQVLLLDHLLVSLQTLQIKMNKYKKNK
jgi:hypothetical protein